MVAPASSKQWVRSDHLPVSALLPPYPCRRWRRAQGMSGGYEYRSRTSAHEVASRAVPCAAECGCATCWRSAVRPAPTANRTARRRRCGASTSAPCPDRIPRMNSRNVFAGPYLERAAQLRSDPAWFDSALADEKSRVVPVWHSRSLIADEDGPGVVTPDVAAPGLAAPGLAAPRAALLDLKQIPAERRNRDELILLGRFNGASFFAYEIETSDPPPAPLGTRFEDLRLVASLLPADEAGLLGYARAMVTWRRRHRFCGTCGAKTVPAKGGHVLICTNPACRHEQ